MAGPPALAFAFALVLVGYTVWDLDRLSGSRHGLAGVSAALDGTARSGPAASGAVLLSAGISLGCRIVMSIMMALMHLIMI